MKRFADLRFMFVVVAALETAYALLAILTPPDLVGSVTGWRLTADGQWLAKLMGVALGAQAWVAWTLRKQPPFGVASALAFYQVGSATVDWVMWLALARDGIFSTPLGRFWTVASIVTHYAVGLLLVLAIRRHTAASSAEPLPAGHLHPQGERSHA